VQWGYTPHRPKTPNITESEATQRSLEGLQPHYLFHIDFPKLDLIKIRSAILKFLHPDRQTEEKTHNTKLIGALLQR
jgi:hypothetical protein